MMHAGLDLSRRKIDVCLLSDEGEVAGQFAVPSDADGLRGLNRRVMDLGVPVRGVIESMTGARFVHDTLEQFGWDVLIADAQKVKGLAPLACKTDKIDARVLAVLSQRDLVPAIWLPDPRVRREREQARFRMHLVKHKSMLKHRIHSTMLSFGHPCPVSDLFGAAGRELLERLELDPSRRIRTLSKGNRQKVALVAALMNQPDVLLFDEPTAGLDPLKEAEFQQIVREAAGRGQTVFLSSHILDEVEDICTRVAILRSGRLVAVSTLDELRHKGVTVFDVMLDGPVPSFAGVPGVVAEQLVEGGVRLSVSGSPKALLAELGRQRVASLRSREPDLEEVFLSYYGVADRR